MALLNRIYSRVVGRLKDYFKILGVRLDASRDEISKAYRKLAQKYHPDSSEEPNAEEQFKLINEAYTVLSTPEKKYRYMGSFFLEKLEERDFQTSFELIQFLLSNFPNDKWVIAHKKLYDELSSRYRRLKKQWEEAITQAKDTKRSISSRLNKIKQADSIINSFNARELWPAEEYESCLEDTELTLNELRIQSKKRLVAVFSVFVIAGLAIVYSFIYITGSPPEKSDKNIASIASPTPQMISTSTPVPTATIVSSPTILPTDTFVPPTNTNTPLISTSTPRPTSTPVPTPTQPLPTPTEKIPALKKATLAHYRSDNGQEVWSAFVREGPGPEHNRVTALVRGEDDFYILGEEDDWYHIKLEDGRKGYIFKPLVKVISE